MKELFWEYLAHTLSAFFRLWGILPALAGPWVTQKGVSHSPSCSAPASEGAGSEMEKHRAKEFQGHLPCLQWAPRMYKVDLPPKNLKFIYIYICIISIYLKWVIICLLLPIFFRLFTWNQQGLNHVSGLMKAELLVDSHDSRRCCSLKSPGWWETLIISRELVTRAEDFE